MPSVADPILEECCKKWLAAEIPAELIADIVHPKHVAFFPEMAGRNDRFTKFWREGTENAEKLRKAWRALEKASSFPGAAHQIYWELPASPRPLEDSPVTHPAHVMRRKADYASHIRNISALLRLLDMEGDEFPILEDDVCLTGSPSSYSMAEFLPVVAPLVGGLEALRQVLSNVDPVRQIATRQIYSTNAHIQHYVGEIARLNQYLKTPCHRALALFANINYPSFSVSPDSIRKAWSARTKQHHI